MDNLVLQGGAFGLCVMMFAQLSWIIKKQAKTIDNHLDGIQKTLAALPCKNPTNCTDKKP